MNTKALGAVIVFVVIVGLFTFFSRSEGNTLLYFTAESDLPDSILYERSQEADTPSSVHILGLNKSYDVIFTLASLENRETEYIYEISSELMNKTEKIVLSPGEKKKISVTLNPQEYQKWVLDSNISLKKKNIIDVTKDSWIAERKDFQVLVREDSLPTIVEEDYHLPISSDVAHFGRIYHINISSLDELREKPFIKDYESKDVGVFEKISANDIINLSVVGNKLFLNVESREIKYISEEKPFIVKLFRERKLKDIKIDETTNKEVVQSINFRYKIK